MAPLGGDICDGGVRRDDCDIGEEIFVGWGASLGVEVFERHSDGLYAFEERESKVRRLLRSKRSLGEQCYLYL